VLEPIAVDELQYWDLLISWTSVENTRNVLNDKPIEIAIIIVRRLEPITAHKINEINIVGKTIIMSDTVDTTLFSKFDLDRLISATPKPITNEMIEQLEATSKEYFNPIRINWRVSRPKVSVPKKCSILGAWSVLIGFIKSLGSVAMNIDIIPKVITIISIDQ
jgi:hypothetical protein